MKRALTALLSAALLSGVVAVPATAAPIVCDLTAMQVILALGYDVNESGYYKCTFRLFQSNQGVHPKWTEDEYIHGGNFFFVEPKDIAEHGWSRADVESYYQQIEQHLFWGTASTPDAQMVELTLKRGPIDQILTAARSKRLGFPVGTFIQETYFDFPPQAPGLYKWRYSQDDAILYPPLSVTASEVLITK